MLLGVRVGQSRPLVAGPDGQGPGAVGGKISGEVGGEITDHLVHRVSVEHQEGRVVSDAAFEFFYLLKYFNFSNQPVETPLDVFLTDVIVGILSHESLHGGFLAFYSLLDLGPSSPLEMSKWVNLGSSPQCNLYLVDNGSSRRDSIGVFEQAKTIGRL